MEKTWNKLSLKKASMHIRVLHQDFGMKVSEIKKKKYPNTPQDVIDRTIESLRGGMQMVIKTKGGRLKY